MYADEIESALRSDSFSRHLFKGVYACDELPKNLIRPAMVVANTDARGSPGSHWVAFYLPLAGKCVYFDSYGLPPSQPEFVEFLNHHCRHWKHNGVDLQSLHTNVCGEYCVLFLEHCARGLSLEEFLFHFCLESTSTNDEYVRTLFSKRHNQQVGGGGSGFGQKCCARQSL